MFAPPGSVPRKHFTPPIGVKYLGDNKVQTFPGNCSPTSNSSASVTTACYSK